MPVFTCQGIPSHGVMLTPPSAPEFQYLLEAIRIRSREKVEGAPPRPEIEALTPTDLACSAILLNYSNKIIHEIAAWWKLEAQGERPRTLCRLGLLGQSDVLPLAPRPPLAAYWNVILPGSVRLLTREHLFGDNRDIRPPRPEELHHGGWVQGGGGPLDAIDAQTVHLALDAVLFAGGEFTGEDKCGLWPQLNAEVEVKAEAAAVAKNAVAEGRSPEEAIASVRGSLGEAAVGVHPPMPQADPRGYQRFVLNQYLTWASQRGGASDTIAALLPMAALPAPPIRRT